MKTRHILILSLIVVGFLLLACKPGLKSDDGVGEESALAGQAVDYAKMNTKDVKKIKDLGSKASLPLVVTYCGGDYDYVANCNIDPKGDGLNSDTFSWEGKIDYKNSKSVYGCALKKFTNATVPNALSLCPKGSVVGGSIGTILYYCVSDVPFSKSARCHSGYIIIDNVYEYKLVGDGYAQGVYFIDPINAPSTFKMYCGKKANVLASEKDGSGSIIGPIGFGYCGGAKYLKEYMAATYDPFYNTKDYCCGIPK